MEWKIKNMNTIQSNLHKWETNLKPLASVVDDLISRQAAKNRKVYSYERHEYVVPVAEIDWLPSAQPEQRWIPFQFRPMTEEEKAEFILWDIGEDEEIICGEKPDDGQEILVSYNGYVFTDTFELDEGYYLDGMGEIEHGMAWMPLPEPYKEGEE